MTAFTGVSFALHPFDYGLKIRGGKSPITHPVISSKTVLHPLTKNLLSCLNSTLNSNFQLFDV
jgi:hypothetical protein